MLFYRISKVRRGIPLSAADDNERAERENDCWFLRRLCDAARDGAIGMVTSMLTVAECTHVGEDGVPPSETRNLFVDFLTSGQVARLVAPDIFVAEQARDLLWTHDIKLKGADSLHVATALIEGCREFVTWDHRIKKQLLSEAIPKLSD